MAFLRVMAVFLLLLVRKTTARLGWDSQHRTSDLQCPVDLLAGGCRNLTRMSKTGAGCAPTTWGLYGGNWLYSPAELGSVKYLCIVFYEQSPTSETNITLLIK